MSRRDRVTRKKGMQQRESGRKNQNPKLSAFQREKKRNRLANQPPIILKEQRDSPSSARNIAAYIEDQARKRREAREKKYGPKISSSSNAASAFSSSDSAAAQSSSSSIAAAATRETFHAAGVEKNLKNRVNNVQSLNEVVAAGTNLDESRVRLEVLAKKAKLRQKKKLRRRTKKGEIEHAQLARIMNQNADGSSSKKGKKDLGAGDKNGATKKEPDVPLTRAEKKKVQLQKLRQEAKAEARLKALQEEQQQQQQQQQDSALGSSHNNNKGDETDGEYDENGETDLPPENYRGPETEKKKRVAFAGDNDDDDDGTMKNKMTTKLTRAQKTYDDASKKSFKQLDYDYVRYGDRVDAPPVLDVVPSFTLAAALERRTRKMQSDDHDAFGSEKGGTGKKSASAKYGSSALDRFRVIDTAGQTSISELAQKTVHGRRAGAMDIFHLQQKSEKNAQNAGNFLQQSVSGAKLQGKEDFAALREKVLESYAKHHPKAFGKSRTYTPL